MDEQDGGERLPRRHRAEGTFVARYGHEGHNLGTFGTAREAAVAYARARLKAEAAGRAAILELERSYQARGMATEVDGLKLHLSVNNVTGYKGVGPSHVQGKFKADSGGTKLGCMFDTAVDAAVAYARHLAAEKSSPPKPAKRKADEAAAAPAADADADADGSPRIKLKFLKSSGEWSRGSRAAPAPVPVPAAVPPAADDEMAAERARDGEGSGVYVCRERRELVYTHTNSALGAELSTSTVTVPVTGASVSTVTRQPSGGRATAAGKPLAATTWTRTTAIDGKTSCLQKSKCQLVAALCVSESVARVPSACPSIELCSMRTPSIVTGGDGAAAPPMPTQPLRVSDVHPSMSPAQHCASAPVAPSHAPPAPQNWYTVHRSSPQHAALQSSSVFAPPTRPSPWHSRSATETLSRAGQLSLRAVDGRW